MKNQTLKIQAYILKHLEKHPSDIAAKVCAYFSVTRMTATRHLQALLRQGKIIKSGSTFDTRYYLSSAKNKSIHVAIDRQLDEHAVFEKYLSATFHFLPANQLQIGEYCCTELINNAKDHSQGSRLTIQTTWGEHGLTTRLIDNGIGIFKNLQKLLHLSDLQEGMLALSKGKVTTDPKNHTGEGIFFSSRLVDRFEIEANGIHYIKDNVEDDWLYQQTAWKSGTKITLFIDRHCTRNMRDVFNQYTETTSYQFDKTEILVELSKLGYERYISRSQAKRILTDLEKFSRIVLDFRGIDTVGQGFVDEVFRVFQQKHPHIQITYRHANDNVLFMIERGLAAG